MSKIVRGYWLFPHSWTTQSRESVAEDSKLHHRLLANGGWIQLWRGLAWSGALLGCVAWLGCAGSTMLESQQGMRDFPPLADPNRPAPGTVPAETSSVTRPEEVLSRIPELPAESASEDVYRLGVGDELNIVTVGQPQFTRPVKVLPDGTISTPGAGTLYVLGSTVTEASTELESRLAKFLKYPRVDVVVTEYGEHVVYVMGEVPNPSDHPYRKGMTALQAVAMAGGFETSAERQSVVVFRRVGADVAEFHQIDLGSPLEGEEFANDMVLRPYDIVYVPKTFIANVNAFVDHWFRQNLSALTFYLEGWDAYSVTKDRVVISRNVR